MQRPREQFLGIGFFNDLTEIQHRHAMAEKADGAEVVGNEKIGRTQFALQPPQEVDDFGACGGIQRRGRLIQYDQLRPGDDGAPNSDTLLLARRSTPPGIGRARAPARPSRMATSRTRASRSARDSPR